MSNLHITAFDSFDFTQTGINTTGGSVGNKKARWKPLHPPHSAPLDPYGSSDAPYEFKQIKTNLLIRGTPNAVEALVVSIRAKVTKKGTLTGKAGTTTRTCTARCLEITGDWTAPFMTGATQWLYLTVAFQQLTEWA